MCGLSVYVTEELASLFNFVAVWTSYDEESVCVLQQGRRQEVRQPMECNQIKGS